MKQVVFYRTENGREPAHEWLSGLDKASRIKVYSSIDRVALGSSKHNIRALGDGIFEIKIAYGPGLRVYFGQAGNVVIVLLAGGDKSTQFRDIRKAREYWRNYVSK